MALGFGLAFGLKRKAGGGGGGYGGAPATRGPEIAPSLTDGAWTTALANTSQDGTGLHFNGTDSGNFVHTTTGFEDGATYEIIWTQTIGASGSFRWQVYGATNAHLGQSTSHTTSGTFTEQVTLSAAGSLNNTIRANANAGTAGSNFVNITALSIKKVLA